MGVAGHWIKILSLIQWPATWSSGRPIWSFSQPLCLSEKLLIPTESPEKGSLLVWVASLWEIQNWFKLRVVGHWIKFETWSSGRPPSDFFPLGIHWELASHWIWPVTGAGQSLDHCSMAYGCRNSSASEKVQIFGERSILMKCSLLYGALSSSIWFLIFENFYMAFRWG